MKKSPLSSGMFDLSLQDRSVHGEQERISVPIYLEQQRNMHETSEALYDMGLGWIYGV